MNRRALRDGAKWPDTWSLWEAPARSPESLATVALRARTASTGLLPGAGRGVPSLNNAKVWLL